VGRNARKMMVIKVVSCRLA